MTPAERFQALQKHVAQISANGSSMRKSGPPGMIAAAQKFLREMSLTAFASGTKEAFMERLNAETEKLRLAFPKGGQNWGTARKVLNLFLRDCSYNRFLSDEHKLAKLDAWLEVPIDRHVASNLAVQADSRNVEWPRWTSIKELAPADSATFQRIAQDVADARSILRADLDLIWWRNPLKFPKRTRKRKV